MDYRNPLIWLRRIRKRCGYGVHSPFAFELLTQVIYSPGQYYAYRELDKLHTLADRMLRPRRRAVDRLLFRLVNSRQPGTLRAVGGSARLRQYMQAATSRRLDEGKTETPDFLYYDGDDTSLPPMVAEGGTLVVDHLQKHRALWRALHHDEHYTVLFDLHDVGIAIRRSDLQRDSYTVNW